MPRLFKQANGRKNMSRGRRDYSRRNPLAPEHMTKIQLLHKQREEFMEKMKDRINARREKLEPILEAAKEACQRLGGWAMIDDRYVVVDTKYFNVSQKDKTPRQIEQQTTEDERLAA